MSINKQNMYSVEKHIAEIYDDQITETHDIDFILNLLEECECRSILEPFCGTGRILIPLVEKGYDIVGIDSSEEMLKRLKQKIETNENLANKIIPLKHEDVTLCDWESGFDAVIMGCNCFFELATLEEQEKVIQKAFHSVKPGGYIYIDSESIENELPDYWCNIDVENSAFPSGRCSDGIELKGFSKPVYVDKKNKIWKARRRVEIYKDNTLIGKYSYDQQKHPIGQSEIKKIVNDLGLQTVGSWNGTENPESLTADSSRVTLWLKKIKK